MGKPITFFHLACSLLSRNIPQVLDRPGANDPTIPPQFEQTKLFLMSPKFSYRELHKIHMYVGTVIILNPDDCKLPKTFGSNILIFQPFLNLLALYIEYRSH